MLAAATLAAGIVVATSASATGSGLYGVVLRGPIQPVCVVGDPCEAPAQVTLVFSRTSIVVARTRSNAKGRFTIALRPGRYTVRTTERFFGRIPRPLAVTVPTGRYARVTFRIDTGIR